MKHLRTGDERSIGFGPANNTNSPGPAVCEPLHEAFHADAYLGRQPIVDAHGALAGYELLFRSDRTNGACIIDGDLATAQVVENTIGAFGTGDLLKDYPGYLNVGSNFLMNAALEVLPPECFVLEILEDVCFDEAVIDRCRALRGAGYRIALDDVSPTRVVPDSILAAIEIAKIDVIATPATQLAETIERFRRRGIVALAEKVETHESFQRARAFGCTLFQGYFFARPETLHTRKPRGGGGPLLRLLSLLAGEPRLSDLEEALKATPSVVVQLLRLANAASNGPRCPVNTLREAIGRVGTDRMMRWIQLILFALGSQIPPTANPLVQLVGARARFMELAARRLANRKLVYSALPSQAYLVGILSLAHVALQMTKESLEHELGLSPAIWRAIHSHQGDLGALLQCAEAVETQNEDEIARCARRWPILGNEEIARLAIEAAIWAQRQTECGR